VRGSAGEVSLQTAGAGVCIDNAVAGAFVPAIGGAIP
jgi:hypothetical protein